MFERFTEKAIKVIMLAQEEGRRLGHNFVGTEQILLGLIGEGTGNAAKALESKGVSLQGARVEVEKIIGRGSGFVAVEVPFTPRAKRVLELSWDEARILGHNYIGTEHLLCGLVREDGGVATRVLRILGVEPAELMVEVLDRVRKWEAEWKQRVAVFAEDASVLREKLTGSKCSEELLPFLEKASENAIRVIMFARQEVLRTKHTFVGTEQILLGLVACPSDRVAEALGKAKVYLSNAQMEIEKIIGLGSSEITDIAQIPYSPRTIHALVLSMKAAEELGHDFVDTGHVLLGIIRESEGVACRVLEKFEVDVPSLVSQIRSILHHFRPSSKSDTVSASRAFRYTYEDLFPIFDSFGEEAMQAHLLGQVEAQRLRHNFLGTEHLLLGVAGVFGSKESVLLREMNFDSESARKIAAEIFPNGTGFRYVNGHCPHTPRARKVLVTARREADNFNHKLVDNGHLLLGLLQDEDYIAMRILRRVNIDPEELRTKIKSLFEKG